MSKYIFVVKGEKPSSRGDRRSARSVLEARFKLGIWPLNLRTPHQQELNAGDEVLFYVAGSGDPDRYHFIARAEVSGPRVRSARRWHELPAWLGTQGPPLYDVPLRSMIRLAQPISIKPLIRQLSFICNKTRWGTSLQGGVRRISNEEFTLILNDARD
jgi:predicted RNA-binding protein